jgi:amidase
MTSWKEIAAAKRESILESIPSKWRISQIPSRAEQKDVTGPYIHQFLNKTEIDITETDVIGIANQISSSSWKATEVTEAFCHRASLAHQLVRSTLF